METLGNLQIGQRLYLFIFTINQQTFFFFFFDKMLEKCSTGGPALGLMHLITQMTGCEWGVFIEGQCQEKKKKNRKERMKSTTIWVHGVIGFFPSQPFSNWMAQMWRGRCILAGFSHCHSSRTFNYSNPPASVWCLFQIKAGGREKEGRKTWLLVHFCKSLPPCLSGAHCRLGDG